MRTGKVRMSKLASRCERETMKEVHITGKKEGSRYEGREDRWKKCKAGMKVIKEITEGMKDRYEG